MSMIASAAIALLVATSPASGSLGPQPNLEEFSAMADAALASKLKDPQSVTFKWPYQLIAGPDGYYTCGLVDTLNKKVERRDVWVSAVIANGKVLNPQWSTENGMLAWECKNLVRKGTLIPR